MDENASAAIEVDDLPCLPKGTIVGGYVLRECVGRGAMAHIYRAKHCVLGREVALKLLAPSLMADKAARNRLLREARVTATLKHPNIIDVSDARFHDGNPYLVMDLLCGEDLQSRLMREERLPHDETVELGLALASGLGAAHARGIVHRDIKPGNVFLSRGADGEIVPKLLDFGISRAPITLSGTDLSATPRDELMGSPLYLSPEGVLGAHNLDARSDQYALGVMLYECVTGRPPYLEDTLYALFQAIVKGKIRPPSELIRDIPPALEDVILRALSHDPARRFSSMLELGIALVEAGSPRTRVIWSLTFGVRAIQVRAGLETTALSLDRTMRLKRPRKRQRMLAMVSATVVAIPALYVFWHVTDPEPAQRHAESVDTAWPSVNARWPEQALQTAPLDVPRPPEAPTAESFPVVIEPAPVAVEALPVTVEAGLGAIEAGLGAIEAGLGVAKAEPVAVPTRPTKKRAGAGKAGAGRAADLTASLALTAGATIAGAGGSARASSAQSEQDEVRRLFAPARARPTRVARASWRIVTPTAEKLAR